MPDRLERTRLTNEMISYRDRYFIIVRREEKIVDILQKYIFMIISQASLSNQSL